MDNDEYDDEEDNDGNRQRIRDNESRIYQLESTLKHCWQTVSKIENTMNIACTIYKKKSASMGEFYREVAKFQEGLKRADRNSMISCVAATGPIIQINARYSNDTKAVSDMARSEMQGSACMQHARGGGNFKKTSEELLKDHWHAIKDLVGPDTLKRQWDTQWPQPNKPFEWTITCDGKPMVSSRVRDSGTAVEITIADNMGTVNAKQFTTSMRAETRKKSYFLDPSFELVKAPASMGRHRK